MRGRLLDVDVKRGLRAAKALRAHSKRFIPPNPLSDNTERVSRDVTAHINGNWKSRDMRAYPEPAYSAKSAFKQRTPRAA